MKKKVPTWIEEEEGGRIAANSVPTVAEYAWVWWFVVQLYGYALLSGAMNA